MEIPNFNYMKVLFGGNKTFEDILIRISKRAHNTYNNFKGRNYLLAAKWVHKLKYNINILGLEKNYGKP